LDITTIIFWEQWQMKLLSTASVMERLDRSSKETIRQMVKRGELPQPIRGANGAGNYWTEVEIDKYIESLAGKTTAPDGATATGGSMNREERVNKAIAEAGILYRTIMQKAYNGSASPRSAVKAMCLQCVGVRAGRYNPLLCLFLSTLGLPPLPN
jgi:predicted DNA-binding transcriptional regulator AlpA